MLSHLRAVLVGGDRESLAILTEYPRTPILTSHAGTIPKRIKGVFVALSISMWLWMPIPGGALFPVFGMILAVNLSQTPVKMVTPSMLLYFLFSFSELKNFNG